MRTCSHRTARPLAALLVVAAVTIACGSSKPKAKRPTPTSPGVPLATPRTQRIGPEGGTITSDDGRVTVRVPPGSLQVATDFSVQPITNTAPSGLGGAYRLGPEGTTFLRPVTFTFVAGFTGTPVTQLAVAFRDAQGFWTNVPTVTRDLGAKTISVHATHFSDWAIVSADPTRDMTGAFTLQSSTDVPVAGNGSATLTYQSEDATERIYLLSGTTTLQQAGPFGGAACTPIDNPAYPFPTNVAEVFGTDRFWWGTSAHWNLTCGGTPASATTAFDTMGINLIGCDRRYVATPTGPAPIISLDRLQGSYVIDCSARGGGSVTATWDFFRCGAACTSTNVCHTAAYACATGTPVCTDNGNVTNGTTCGTNQVCGDGVCNACTVDEPCTPQANPCHVGRTECSTGFPVCVDTLAPQANGTTCGTDRVCNGGTCVACTAGKACTPPTNACDVGATSCATGTEVCTDTGTPLPNGTSCGTNQVCYASGTPPVATCNACTAGVPCTPADVCHAGTTSCTTGVSVCLDAGATAATNGVVCGTNAVCNGGACSACTAGVACTPANPCHNGATSCSTGTSQCVDLGTPVGNGSACGTNAVCNNGTCSACTAGLACTPADPCHEGRTDCSSGVSVCMDTGIANTTANGTTCGTNQVCSSGACIACTQDAACTPANPCHQGKTDCRTGTPTCVDQNALVAAGTSCGAGLVCDAAGACAACAQGAPCTLDNVCVAAATIQCGTGIPVCTAQAPVPNGTSCSAPGSSGLACTGGSCEPSPCSAPGSCIPANPCHAGSFTCDTTTGTGIPSSCVDTTVAVADGTSCGTNLFCKTGSCLACPAAAGTTCTSTNSCAATAAVSCATGAAVCTDTAFKPDGTSCGTNLVCASGACVSACPALQGIPCTSACLQGGAGTYSCATGTPVCTGTPVTNGTSCGTNLVCESGACVPSCPALEGTACTSTNPCTASTGAISCASGAPVCNATALPDGTSCGTGLTCVQGVCQ